MKHIFLKLKSALRLLRSDTYFLYTALDNKAPEDEGVGLTIEDSFNIVGCMQNKQETYFQQGFNVHAARELLN